MVGVCLILPQSRTDTIFVSLQTLHCYDGFAEDYTDCQVGTGRNLSPGRIDRDFPQQPRGVVCLLESSECLTWPVHVKVTWGFDNTFLFPLLCLWQTLFVFLDIE